jgi:hypothetical protein
MKAKVLARLILVASVLLTQAAPAVAVSDGYLSAARDDRQYQDERRDGRRGKDYRKREEERSDRFEGYGRGYEKREQEKGSRERGQRR